MLHTLPLRLIFSVYLIKKFIFFKYYATLFVLETNHISMSFFFFFFFLLFILYLVNNVRQNIL